ncbi:hypothetical protein RJT34_11688 [Clitoria ternatea]|uniref:O-methyltransferase C-terminal domain-containing protein n=1 Tax=Clitoria ternatea TaxID=43366 RepID=A0AAN9JKJ1_CLITE
MSRRSSANDLEECSPTYPLSADGWEEVELGIPDIIHNYGQPMPLSDLIASLPIHPSKTHCIFRLMRILISIWPSSLNIISSFYQTMESLWDYAGHHPEYNHVFNDGMASDSQLVASLVIEKSKKVFNGLESLVDVGGGTGTLAKAIAKSFPQLECIVLDLPHVVDGLHRTQNVKYVGRDMFKEIPAADAIMLKLYT